MGLATLYFEPNPWWKPDWYLADLPKDDQGNQVEGLTITDEASLGCVCTTCPATGGTSPCGERLECSIRMSFHVEIHIGVPDFSREYVYGHEQLHIANMKSLANDTKAALDDAAQRCGCATPEICATYISQVMNHIFPQFKRHLEMDPHDDPMKRPQPGMRYPPHRNYFPDPKYGPTLPVKIGDIPGASPGKR